MLREKKCFVFIHWDKILFFAKEICVKNKHTNPTVILLCEKSILLLRKKSAIKW
jgi:hypothetical protein